MPEAPTVPFTPSPLDLECVTFVVTGCVSAALLPFWVNWACVAYPDVKFNVTVSRAAEQFVSVAALSHLVNGSVIVDSWDSTQPGRPIHRELARETDGWAVYPASLNSVSKLAARISDTPALAALNMTKRPIVIAAAFPEGALENPIVTQNVERLRNRPNIHFVGGEKIVDRGIDVPTVFATLSAASVDS